MASSAAAAPIVQEFQDRISDTNPNDSPCDIDGSSYFNELDNIQVLGDGRFKIEITFKYVFTASGPQ
jgi:hypothetical protein